MADLQVHANNDYVIERAITQRNPTTGKEEPATGLTGGVGFLALKKGGATIHASLSVGLTERSAALGTYFGVVQGSDLATQITPAMDRNRGFECVQFGSDYKEYVSVTFHLAREGG